MEQFKAFKNTTSDIFETRYGSPLEEIPYEDIPLPITGLFETQAQKYIHIDDYRPRNFKKIYRLTHPSGDITYIALQDKTYDTNKETERLAFFVDTRGEDMTGRIEVRLNVSNQNEYFLHKPFVGITGTEEKFRNEGLARRRLEEANAFSVAEYGYPLNSDTIISDGAKRVWERLVTEGLAEKYQEENSDRYRFIETPVRKF